MNQNHVSVVKRDDLHTGLIKLKVNVHENLFEGIYHLLESGRLEPF